MHRKHVPHHLLVALAAVCITGDLWAMSNKASISAASTNTAGASAAAPIRVVEFYNASLDHYFITADRTEIGKLDSGVPAGWARTGYDFPVLPSTSTIASTTPVCRYYGRPEAGLDSHFYSAAPDECAAVLTKFPGTWTLESSNVFRVTIPDRTTGACPSGKTPVYRLFNGRTDVNHRYTSDVGVRNAMLSGGYIAEGYGASGVAFCAEPQSLTSGQSATASQLSPNIVVTPIAPDTFDFSSTVASAPDTAIVAYAWDFGDGSTASGATSSHTYTVSGTFPVVLTVTDSKRNVGTAKSTVTAKPATATSQPASDPTVSHDQTGSAATGTVTTSGTRVRASAAQYGTSWVNASNALNAPWVQGGGDWLDKNGVFDGPTPTISQRLGASTTIDISKIDGDLLVQGIYGWESATIDGKPATGFWTDASTAGALPLPAKWNNPSMILNPNHGSTLVLNAPSAIAQTVRIDKIAGPAVNDYPNYVGPSYTPDVFELEMKDYASIVAQAGGSGNMAQPWAYDPEFGVDPQTQLKYLRFSGSPTTGTRLISWFLPFKAPQTIHARYCIYIEDDVADGMVEAGVKLPGLSNDNSQPVQPELISWRMEHGRVAPNNRGLYSFVDYLYDAESGSGFGGIHPMGGATLRAGRWYVVEQAIRLNTPGVSDGYGEVWLNGQSVWRSDTVRYRNNASTTVNRMHVNVYHGGMTPPSNKIHYRIAKIGVSSDYIGIPSEFQKLRATSVSSGFQPTSTAAFPAWRVAMSKADQIYQIANTASLDGVWAQGNGSSAGANIIDAWNGLAAGPHSWYSAASSGHDQGNGNGWENKVIKIDLSVDSPRWTLVHPGSPRSAVQLGSYYADGLPTARHTYYTTQFISGAHDRNGADRIMLFTTYAPYGMGMVGDSTDWKTVDGFRLADATWDSAGTWAKAPFASYNGVTAVAKDPRTEDVYIAASDSYAKWTAATGQWGSLDVNGVNGGVQGSWQFHPTLIDGKRNAWIHVSEFKKMQQVDLISLKVKTMPLTGELPAEIQDYSMVVHDIDNDRYLTVQPKAGGGTALYAINPDTGVVTRVLDAPSPVNGTQSRVAYFAELGGVAYLPQFASNIYFIPTR